MLGRQLADSADTKILKAGASPPALSTQTPTPTRRIPAGMGVVIMTFAERLDEQRKRLIALTDRQRVAFADEYARMEAATANDPQLNDEDSTDLG